MWTARDGKSVWNARAIASGQFAEQEEKEGAEGGSSRGMRGLTEEEEEWDGSSRGERWECLEPYKHMDRSGKWGGLERHYRQWVEVLGAYLAVLEAEHEALPLPIFS